MTPEDYRALLPYATPTQRRNVEALLEHGSQRKAAAALGIGARPFEVSLASLRKRAARRDMAQHVDNIPEGYYGEASTLIDGEGNVRLQWQKSKAEKHDPEAFASAVEAAIECLPAAAPVAPLARTHSALCNVMPIGDPHYGMLSWEPETGEDWDLSIAAAVHAKAIGRLLGKAPVADTTLVVWMGDQAHADDVTAQTPASKHNLDVDSRWERMIGVLFASMCNSVNVALQRSREVVVRVVKGNHDPHVSAALALALEAHYRNDPRVCVDRSPKTLWVTTWGRVLLSFAHGHNPAPARVHDILHADYRAEIGATEQGYCYTGHKHSKILSERGGLIFEAVQTLAAKDAYAAGAGYRSGRGLFVDTFHRKYLAPIERVSIAAQDVEL